MLGLVQPELFRCCVSLYPRDVSDADDSPTELGLIEEIGRNVAPGFFAGIGDTGGVDENEAAIARLPATNLDGLSPRREEGGPGLFQRQDVIPRHDSSLVGKMRVVTILPRGRVGVLFAKRNPARVSSAFATRTITGYAT